MEAEFTVSEFVFDGAPKIDLDAASCHVSARGTDEDVAARVFEIADEDERVGGGSGELARDAPAN